MQVCASVPAGSTVVGRRASKSSGPAVKMLSVKRACVLPSSRQSASPVQLTALMFRPVTPRERLLPELAAGGGDADVVLAAGDAGVAELVGRALDDVELGDLVDPVPLVAVVEALVPGGRVAAGDTGVADAVERFQVQRVGRAASPFDVGLAEVRGAQRDAAAEPDADPRPRAGEGGDGRFFREVPDVAPLLVRQVDREEVADAVGRGAAGVGVAGEAEDALARLSRAGRPPSPCRRRSPRSSRRPRRRPPRSHRRAGRRRGRRSPVSRRGCRGRPRRARRPWSARRRPPDRPRNSRRRRRRRGRARSASSACRRAAARRRRSRSPRRRRSGRPWRRSSRRRSGCWRPPGRRSGCR